MLRVPLIDTEQTDPTFRLEGKPKADKGTLPCQTKCPTSGKENGRLSLPDDYFLFSLSPESFCLLLLNRQFVNDVVLVDISHVCDRLLADILGDQALK